MLGFPYVGKDPTKQSGNFGGLLPFIFTGVCRRPCVGNQHRFDMRQDEMIEAAKSPTLTASTYDGVATPIDGQLCTGIWVIHPRLHCEGAKIKRGGSKIVQ